MNSIKSPKIVNKKAKFFYSFEIEMEAGLVLRGKEVKQMLVLSSLDEGYIYIKSRELIWRNDHREIKLLLHKREINRVAGAYSRRGMVIIPLELYRNKSGFFKIKIGVGIKLKHYDLREKIKKREQSLLEKW